MIKQAIQGKALQPNITTKTATLTKRTCSITLKDLIDQAGGDNLTISKIS
jgi:hypothetical protein